MLKINKRKLRRIFTFNSITVENEKFYNYHNTKCLTNSVGFNKNHVIKVEHKKNKNKINDIKEEAEVIQHLKDNGCISCPKLIKTGQLGSGENYMVLERIRSKGSPSVADMLFSLIEQKNLGIYQGDFKPENMIFDGKVCYLIDYDQAQEDREFLSMGNVDFLNWIEKDFFQRRGHEFFKDENRNFDKDKFLECFEHDSFNLGLTSVFKAQETTDTKTGFYHKIHEKEIFINGARTLDERKPILDKINLDEGEKVLDVGCNAGLLTHYLFERGCRVSGTDMDRNIIIGAKMTANILKKDINYFQCDIDKNKFKNSYDTICLFSVLHHFKNMKENANFLAKKCNRIIIEARLKEGGSKPFHGFWIKTSKWNFANINKLISFLEDDMFPNFKFEKKWGKSDRDRYIITLLKKKL